MLDVEQLLEDLTEPQRQAATHIDGPLLIIAGAGSGKTRVITRRVAYLLSQGVKAWQILAITFTNKAAGEMKSRVAAVIDRPLRDFGRLDQPWPLLCTFHSLCLRILRHYGPRVELPNNFSIFDSSDQTKLIKDAIKLLDISSTNFTPSAVHAKISNAKNQLISPEEFASRNTDFTGRHVARVYTKYQKLLEQNNALDFDDLLLRAVKAMRDHPDVLAELQERFQYILIDEYQDTNHAQYLLAHALALRHQNLCVVGDPDQSIYAWRGADLSNILDFEKDYPGAVVVRLEQNYRSTKRILRIASSLISHNSQRKDKTLWTENAEGEKGELLLCQDEKDEATLLVERFRNWHDHGGHDWNKMAIFYRTNALSRAMEDALRRGGIPYQIARGVEFYNRKEIKDALAYLRVVANSSDEVSLTRIANVPARGLGDAAMKTLSAYAVTHGVGLWEAVCSAAAVPGISTRAASGAREFVRLVEHWRKIAFGPRPATPTGAAAAAPNSPQANPVIAAGEQTQSQPSESASRAPAAQAGDAIVDLSFVDVDLFGTPSGPGLGASAMKDSQDLPVGSSGDIELEDSAYIDDAEPTDVGGEADGEHATIDPFVDPVAAPPRPTTPPLRIKLHELASTIFRESGLEAYLRKTGGEELDELANVEELINSAADYQKENPTGSLSDFLAQVSLVSDADHMEGTGGAVTLMTLHAAKGLEFPVVGIIGLEEGILPHSRARTDPNQLEEERRLCFVGITRAQQRILLSRAARRMVRGVTERTVPSPFLDEIPMEEFNVTDRTSVEGYGGARRSFGENTAGKWSEMTTRRVEPDEASSGFVTPGGRFSHVRPGQQVRHAKFGLGRIQEMQTTGDQRTRAVVRFNDGGLRTLILEYAPVEVLID